MPSPKLSVRVSDETYSTLIKLAEIEKKSITELVRELIDQGLGKRQTIEQDVLDEVRMMRIETGEFIARAIKASAVGAYYAKLATESTDEATHFITTGGQVLDKETKKQRALDRQKRSREIAQRFLTAALDDM